MTWGISTMDDPRAVIDYIEEFASAAIVKVLGHLSQQVSDIEQSYKDNPDVKEALNLVLTLMGIIRSTELEKFVFYDNQFADLTRAKDYITSEGGHQIE